MPGVGSAYALSQLLVSLASWELGVQGHLPIFLWQGLSYDDTYVVLAVWVCDLVLAHSVLLLLEIEHFGTDFDYCAGSLVIVLIW